MSQTGRAVPWESHRGKYDLLRPEMRKQRCCAHPGINIGRGVGLKTDGQVEVHEENGRIIIGKVRPKPVTLEWLLEGVTEENRHPETDWGAPVGKEFW